MDRITLHTPLSALPGVGPARERALSRLGLFTVGDLLSCFPRDYEDRTVRTGLAHLPEEEPVCFAAMIREPLRTTRIRRGMELTKGSAVDDTGQVELTFFNQAYVRTQLIAGETYLFYGRLTGSGRRRQMTNPVFEREGAGRKTGGIFPVYALTAGLSLNMLTDLQRAAQACAGDLPETLPESLRRQHDLADSAFCYRQIHFPDSWESLMRARRRLMFEELFCLNLGLSAIRGHREQEPGEPFEKRDIAPFYAALPYTPTLAQQRAIEDASRDLGRAVPMNRLLQGDVGSGKTLVAAACLYIAHENGFQGAMMAPTELLAEQHCRTLTEMLGGFGIRTALFTGSMTAAQKREARRALAAGEIDVAVGTHALLSEGVDFARLGLVITDEQHRFGVRQRAALTEKRGTALHPHVLVMSATPIPRTLALMLYGDLDLSVLDMLPPGRTPVKTLLIGEDKRQRLYGFVRRQVSEGRQAYIVCASVNEEDDTGRKAAEQHGQHLRDEVFPDLRVAIVHGKMKPKDKQAVMAAFAAGETDVLVSTTVIEVGVDVPNASLMIIENAEQFGLSQLHQLRGRVGRGRHESWCVMISESRSETTVERLRTMCRTTDGFVIAEEDLRRRGPGDFFGSRQHGLPQLRLASLEGDMRLLHEAQEAARAVLAENALMCQNEYAPMREKLARMFRENADIWN